MQTGSLFLLLTTLLTGLLGGLGFVNFIGYMPSMLETPPDQLLRFWQLLDNRMSASPRLEYTTPHVHEDFDEVNIILSPNKLIYKVQLGEEKIIVGNNRVIRIPRGTMHAANVLKGEGYFITLFINQVNSIFKLNK